MEASSSNFDMSAVASGVDTGSFQKEFVWDWYIRLKIHFSDSTETDLSTNLDDISKEYDDFWQNLRATFSREEGRLWQTPFIDTSTAYFFLIGIPSLPSPELAKSRQLLREWHKDMSEKMKGRITSFEAKFIPQKVFLEHGFEVYTLAKPQVAEQEMGTEEQAPAKAKKEKKKDSYPAAGNFKGVKGSNPSEVRRQFLEHNMKASGSSSNPPRNSTGKLRPGKEVLNHMKFDEKYEIGDFVVGYIDRKEGILEKSMQEWDRFGQEELMAYIKDVKSDEIIWDKARKIDLVFGKKDGG